MTFYQNIKIQLLGSKTSLLRLKSSRKEARITSFCLKSGDFVNADPRDEGWSPAAAAVEETTERQILRLISTASKAQI